MVKKLAALAGAGAMLLSVAGPALAFFSFSGGKTGGLDVKNWASVTNNVYTKADTGDNKVSGFCVWSGKIRTGDAEAGSSVYNDVNSTAVSGCKDCGSVKLDNWASVTNNVTTKAYTGQNSISGIKVGGGKIYTGDAAAGSSVTSFVNYTSVGVDLP